MANRLFSRAFQPLRRYATTASDSSAHDDSMRLWKNISIFVAGPACILAFINAELREAEHHAEPRPEFVPYEYKYIRAKKFFWGDGNHSLFHNPQMNALLEGYEEEEHKH